ncbi:TPA: hypothetical protein R1765_001931 [Campylobacter coli]|nr:hypothetical protein [Campylobacter coli]
MPLNDNNWPNGTNLSNVPIKNGVESEIGEDEDLWDTLPANAKKYIINSENFTAVPLTEGKFKVVSRHNIPGTENDEQVVYIADNPSGDGALRVTKGFNIETTGRTAIYLKGQSDLDIAIVDLANKLGLKADKENTYTKDQVDSLLANVSGGILNVFTYKGSLANEAAIKAVENPKSGDCYQAEDTHVFWVYVKEESEESGSWEQLSGGLIDLSNYYTKQEVNIKLADKANKQDLDALTEVVNALANKTKPFTYVQTTDPATPTGDPATDKTKEGETWFNPSNGLIKIRRKGDDDQLFWFDSLDNIKIDIAGDYVTLKDDQTISGVKTFTSTPKSDMPPTSDDDLANKKYVDEAVKNAGGTPGEPPNLSNYVTLDSEQTIEALKMFNVTPKATNKPTSDDDLVNKQYVDEAVKNAGGTPGEIDLTNVSTNITPNADGNYSIGTSEKKFKDGYFKDRISLEIDQQIIQNNWGFGKYYLETDPFVTNKDLDLFSNNDVVTKNYVDLKLNSIINPNTKITSIMFQIVALDYINRYYNKIVCNGNNYFCVKVESWENNKKPTAQTRAVFSKAVEAPSPVVQNEPLKAEDLTSDEILIQIDSTCSDSYDYGWKDEFLQWLFVDGVNYWNIAAYKPSCDPELQVPDQISGPKTLVYGYDQITLLAGADHIEAIEGGWGVRLNPTFRVNIVAMNGLKLPKKINILNNSYTSAPVSGTFAIQTSRLTEAFFIDYINQNQTISGVKTFTKLPQTSIAPTNDTDMVNKAYVDSAIAAAMNPPALFSRSINGVPGVVSQEDAPADNLDVSSKFPIGYVWVNETSNKMWVLKKRKNGSIFWKEI